MIINGTGDLAETILQDSAEETKDTTELMDNTSDTSDLVNTIVPEADASYLVETIISECEENKDCLDMETITPETKEACDFVETLMESADCAVVSDDAMQSRTHLEVVLEAGAYGGDIPHHVCSTCQKSFTQRSNLKTHILTAHQGKRYTCGKCMKSFTRKATLIKHSCMMEQGLIDIIPDQTEVECGSLQMQERRQIVNKVMESFVVKDEPADDVDLQNCSNGG